MIKPMLAKRLDNKPFENDRYIWEVKFDGARILAKTVSGGYDLQSRSGKDKSKLFPELNLETKRPAIIDGEMVIYDDEGHIVFKGIQKRINRVHDIESVSKTHPATFMVFDILSVDGENVEELSLIQRKEIINDIVIPTNNVRVVDYADNNGIALFNKIVGDQGEGVIAKLKTGQYRRDKRDWIKVKAEQQGEFLICGFTPGTGWRESTFGALVLGVAVGDRVIHVGEVGTGFNIPELIRLHHKMLRRISDTCPLGKEPLAATWINPPLLARVNYLEETDAGQLRFPSYKGEV